MAAETRTASERALSLLDAAFFMLESEERMSNVGPLLILVAGFAIARGMMLRGGPHPDLPGPIDDKVDR